MHRFLVYAFFGCIGACFSPTKEQPQSDAPLTVPAITDRCPPQLADRATHIGQSDKQILAMRGDPGNVVEYDPAEIDSISVYRHRYWRSLQYGNLEPFQGATGSTGSQWDGYKVGQVEFFDIDEQHRVVGYGHLHYQILPNRKTIQEVLPWILKLQPEIIHHAEDEHLFAAATDGPQRAIALHVRVYYRCEDLVLELRGVCLQASPAARPILSECKYEGLFVNDSAVVYRTGNSVRNFQ